MPLTLTLNFSSLTFIYFHHSLEFSCEPQNFRKVRLSMALQKQEFETSGHSSLVSLIRSSLCVVCVQSVHFRYVIPQAAQTRARL